MDHTFEEIKEATIGILKGWLNSGTNHSQYGNLKDAVAEELSKSDLSAKLSNTQTSFREITKPFNNDPRLSERDKIQFLEIFWELILDRVITPGMNDSNRELPWFRFARHAKEILEKYDC